MKCHEECNLYVEMSLRGKEPCRCACSGLLYTGVCICTEEGQRPLPFCGCWFQHQDLLTTATSNCQSQPGNLPSCLDLPSFPAELAAAFPSKSPPTWCLPLVQECLVIPTSFGGGSHKPPFFSRSVGVLKRGLDPQGIQQSTPPASSTGYL